MVAMRGEWPAGTEGMGSLDSTAATGASCRAGDPLAAPRTPLAARRLDGGGVHGTATAAATAAAPAGQILGGRAGMDDLVRAGFGNHRFPVVDDDAIFAVDVQPGQ